MPSSQLLQFAVSIVAVAVALSLAFVLDFNVFRFLLLGVTIVLALMWALARGSIPDKTCGPSGYARSLPGLDASA